MFQNAAKRPEIKKVTVTVRKPQDPKRRDSPLASSQPKPSSSSGKHQSPAPRPKISSASLQVPSRKRSSPPESLRRVKRPQVSQKRKKPLLNVFDSSSEDGSDDVSDGPLSAKRAKPSPTPDAPDLSRTIFDLGSKMDEDTRKSPIIEGLDMTRHGAAGKFTFTPVFEEESDKATIVELQYPSNCSPERFELVQPVEAGEYSPLEDIIESIKHICETYLPETLSESLLDEFTGIERRLKRSIREKSLDAFLSTFSEFNNTISAALADGTIAKRLKNVHQLSLPLVERITSQIYSRTISPSVNLLKQYENGTDNIYGELLPPFSNMIFRQTGLKKDHVFVDLGSGVGNVVLQAALEIGCESWGIEMMPNPASLAQKQLKEFTARCKRWSINPGKAHLLKGDFLASPEIDSAIRRADVILINNQAFTPELNDNILMKLLDVKEGTRIVSLKSFVPDGWKIVPRRVQDPRNLLTVVKKEYFSKRVSWTDGGGVYFVATKDSSKLKRFLKQDAS